MAFKTAVKEKLFARIAFDGPAGSGKTYTALQFALLLSILDAGGNIDTPEDIAKFVASNPSALDGAISCIETEHGTASKYLGEKEGKPLFGLRFDVDELAEYSLANYISSIGASRKATYRSMVVDSLSHAWNGKGGALEQVDKSATAKKFTEGWRNVTPLQTRMFEDLLAYPGHVLATMRVKMGYEIKDIDGKKVPVKLGLEPIQRSGVEYEFDCYFNLDLDGVLYVTKTRCSDINKKSYKYEDIPSLVRAIWTWLNDGSAKKAREPSASATMSTDEVVAELAKRVTVLEFISAADTLDKLNAVIPRINDAGLSKDASVREAFGLRRKELTPLAATGT